MVQIRNNVFETNSSSTHSICISRAQAKIPVGQTVHFRTGEYGWENDTVYDTASYLYTGIMNNDGAEENLKKLEEMLDEMGVKCDFRPRGKTRWGGDYGYVDHSYELIPFIHAVLSSKDLLARYLFGNSFINTGNDNQDCEPSGCNIGDEAIWEYDENGKYTEKPNPYHDAENYEYFVKGN